MGIISVLAKSTFFVGYVINLADSIFVNINNNQTIIESKQGIKGATRSLKKSLTGLYGRNFLLWLSPVSRVQEMRLFETVYKEHVNSFKAVPNFVGKINKKQKEVN